MRQQTLPIPNPGDWCDFHSAALILSVNPRTLLRMIDDGRITPYRIGETRMFWKMDVIELAEARIRARRPDLAPRPRPTPEPTPPPPPPAAPKLSRKERSRANAAARAAAAAAADA